jgi:hypothetical protein
VRERLVSQRTGIINQIRTFCSTVARVRQDDPHWLDGRIDGLPDKIVRWVT